MISDFAALHKHPRVLAAGQKRLGQVLIWLCAVALFLLHGITMLMPIALLLVLLIPRYRHFIVALAAAGAVCEHFIVRKGVTVASVLTNAGALIMPMIQIIGVLSGLFVLFIVVGRFSSWPAFAKRFPVLSLHVTYWFGLMLMGPIPILGILIELGPWLLWRATYMIQFASRGQFRNTTFSDHLMYLWPVFGGNLPFGKGFAYLSQHEAQDSKSFTQSQLSGIKLLLLAVVWQWVILLLENISSGRFSDGSTMLALLPAVPLLGSALVLENVGIGTAWASIYTELIHQTLVVAVRGHVVVGCLRLLGFNVFRNTDKPLLAESLIEFWGRLSFYFKELMVEFFFYPTFLRCGWASPGLRLFLAVFAAAFVGNMYFHMLLQPDILVAADLGAIWKEWASRAVYCLCLAIGVWVSMLRQQTVRRSGHAKKWVLRFKAIAGVWTFYAVIRIWNVRSPGAELSDRLDFCLKLIGLP